MTGVGRTAMPSRSGQRARRRGLPLLLGVVIAGLLAPPGALAHVRAGTIAVDYRASVGAATSAAFTASIDQSDHTLHLTRAPGHAILVLGYLGEPFARLDAQGVWVNGASPTALADGLLPRGDVVTSPGPSWRLRGRGRTLSWRDSRAQQLPAGVARSAWAVPLVVDGRAAQLRGQLRRYPAPSLVVWGLLLAGLLVGGVWLALLRRPDVTRAGALGSAALGAAVCPVLALGFALDASASPGTWIEGFNEIVFVGVGLVLLARGHETLRAGATVGLGLISLAVGLLDSVVFVHPVVLSLLPAALTRVLVVVAAGAGLVAIGLGAVGFAELIPAGLEPRGAGAGTSSV